MFTIDLLKGQGIPMKRKPWGVAIAAMAFTIPILAAMTMFGFYLSNRIVIRVTRQEMISYEKNIETLSGAMETQKALEAEKNNINSCLSEALSSIGRHTQWSPILMTVVKNMPDSVVLTRLEVRHRQATKKVRQKSDPSKVTEVSVPANTLQMSVSGRPQANNDKAVKDFKDHLRFSELLALKLEDIKISQKADIFEGQEVVSYDIDCIFKPE
jgi:Tfp pilus assembly protein PilN